jgi:hypothetical protein
MNAREAMRRGLARANGAGKEARMQGC